MDVYCIGLAVVAVSHLSVSNSDHMHRIAAFRDPTLILREPRKRTIDGVRLPVVVDDLRIA